MSKEVLLEEKVKNLKDNFEGFLKVYVKENELTTKERQFNSNILQQIINSISEIQEDKNNLKKNEDNSIFLQEFQKTKERIDSLENEIVGLKNDNKELKSRVMVLRNDQEGRYNEFKKVCMARVHKLVGKKGSDKYILFFRCFSQKIYSEVSKQLYVSNSGNIKVEEVEVAKVLAGKWRPSPKYIRDSYNKYFTQYENGTLCGEKLLAFENYMEYTEGGKKLEF